MFINSLACLFASFLFFAHSEEQPFGGEIEVLCEDYKPLGLCFSRPLLYIVQGGAINSELSAEGAVAHLDGAVGGEESVGVGSHI